MKHPPEANYTLNVAAVWLHTKALRPRPRCRGRFKSEVFLLHAFCTQTQNIWCRCFKALCMHSGSWKKHLVYLATIQSKGKVWARWLVLVTTETSWLWSERLFFNFDVIKEKMWLSFQRFIGLIFWFIPVCLWKQHIHPSVYCFLLEHHQVLEMSESELQLCDWPVNSAALRTLSYPNSQATKFNCRDSHCSCAWAQHNPWLSATAQQQLGLLVFLELTKKKIEQKWVN